MRYAKLFTALIAVITLNACKKSDSKTDKPSGNSLSALETKVVGKWQLVASVDSNIAVSPASVSDVTADCEKDDVYTFSSDKTFTVDGGTNKCPVSDWGGTWNIRTILVDTLEQYSFEADLINCLCYSYPSLLFIDDTKMVLRNTSTSRSSYKTNTYRRL